jgi:zinc and cadmium transporter
VTPAHLAFVAVGAVSALSLLGAGTLVLDETTLQRLVPVVVDLAVGTLVGATFFDLIPDAVSRHASGTTICVGLVAGYLGFAALDRLMHVRSAVTVGRSLVMLNLVGDVLHNFVDGALIAASFLASPAIGVIATLAIALHEVPRELGSLAIFLHAGVSRHRAVALNAFTGVAAFAGASLMLVAGARVEGLAVPALPVAGGTFLYLARAIVTNRPGRASRLPLFLVGLAITALAARLG